MGARVRWLLPSLVGKNVTEKKRELAGRIVVSIIEYVSVIYVAKLR